jgi:hypothetical protein
MSSDEFEELLRDFPGQWEVVPVHYIWEKQLLPLMKDPEVFESYELAIHRLMQNRFWELRPKKRWQPRWRYDASRPPFMLTHSDGAVMYFGEQIEKAEKEADPLAVHYSKIQAVICDEFEGDWEEGEVTPLSKRTIRELERRGNEIYAKFYPKPDELRHWIPTIGGNRFGRMKGSSQPRSRLLKSLQLRDAA